MDHLRLVVPVDVERATGGNIYDLRMAAELRRLGVQVDLVRASDADLAAVVTGPGMVLIDGLLASHRPEVVRACRAGVLLHMPLAWRSPEQADLERETLRAASVVVATSDWTARFLLEEYDVRAVMVRPGVDPAQIVVGSDPPLIVQVATLTPNKDQLAVVQALAEVADLPWRARLVGSIEVASEYAAQVRSAVIDAGLADRIEIPGVLPQDDAFAGANLLLLPSRQEAYGMVVTEALARGIPAIVSPGGPAEALGRTLAGNIPGLVLSAVDEGDVGARLETQLRHWLTHADTRSTLQTHALTRRTALESWESRASQLAADLSPGHANIHRKVHMDHVRSIR